MLVANVTVVTIIRCIDVASATGVLRKRKLLWAAGTREGCTEDRVQLSSLRNGYHLDIWLGESEEIEGREPGMSTNARREMRQDQYIASTSERWSRISDLGNAGRCAKKARQVSLCAQGLCMTGKESRHYLAGNEKLLKSKSNASLLSLSKI